ncbi:MAG: ABC transporter substrate-binding protein [Kofleriaceae bacterium]
MPRLHAITVAIALAVAGSAQLSCGSHPTPRDTIVMLIETAMMSADPRFAQPSYDSKLSKLVYSGLTAVDTSNLEPRLELASRVTRLDDLTWEVELRPDARFSTGDPVTAEDVVFTYRSVLDPATKSNFLNGFTERFRSVEVTRPGVVTFRLHAPLATFMTDIDFGIMSERTIRRGIHAGAGPYVVRELTTTHVLLDANPHYFGDKPRMPHVEIKFVGDASARLLMLAGGSADLIQNAVRLDLANDVRQRPNLTLASGPSVILTYLMMNNDHPVLRDRRVRQAIALALDRPAIISAMYGGHARLATGLIAPGHWAYNPNVAVWNHDLTRAAALLDEAGRPDPDGDGPLPRFRLVYKTSSDAFRVAVARVIASQLSRVGIAVDVRSFEFQTFFTDVKKGSYELASLQTGEVSEPDYYFTFFHSSRIPTATKLDGMNRWRYRNAEVDRLTTAGRRELDRTRRKQMYDEVQRQVALDVPMIPLWHEDNVVISTVGVQGYSITPNARLIGLKTATKR